MNNKNYTAISLFAGVGGICLGFMKNGVDIVFANDIDKNACKTYGANFKHGITEAPIEEVKTDDIPDADMVIFGFPCTSFSIAGYQKGFEDERSGHLFFEALRIIKAKQPKAFLLENVKNLVGHDKGNTFKVITEALEDAGYYFRYQVLNSMEYGNVPQNRERIYVVGFKDKEQCDKFYFPEPIALTTKIEDITKPNEKKEQKYYYENSKYYPMLKEAMNSKETVYQLRRVYVRENKKNVCPTLTANMGTGGHNVPLIIDDFGIRKLTPKECFMLQGFPRDYKLPEGVANGQLYKQAGNSVTVTVIERIAKNMINAMNETK
ncbi:DNA cytosine methyltransferase [Clostridium sp.]|uniref:DNA cytosine methyltransferase n=1 Tax=Clostridium sp. TaxID=1506 RepID=UPI0025C24F96|nr:DNA cytosine methyltransferase [Clostridium sp.]